MIRLLIICLTLMIAACTHPQTSRSIHANDILMHIHQEGIPVVGKVNLKPFSTIETDGFYNLQVISNQQRYAVEITGDKAIVEHVQVRVKDKVLHLTMHPDFIYDDTGPLSVKVYVPSLKHLRYSGNGEITISQMQNDEDGLVVDSTGSGTVNLYGDINLTQLNTSGSGTTNIYWVNTCRLIVRAEGNSKIFLGGMATNLDAELQERACLNARFLRVKIGYINTTDRAHADVSVNDSLNMLASGSSSIFYYLKPHFIAPYMGCSGLIVSKATDPCCYCQTPDVFCDKDE